MSQNLLLEPWMRGPIEGVDPLTAPALYALRHAREDLEKWTAGFTPAQLWASVHGLAPVGFHIRHIAGSTDRLMTYLEGATLSEEQLRRLKSEDDWNQGTDRQSLLSELEAVFQRSDAVIRALDPATLSEPRAIGRKKLPTTVIGLLQHIGEHAMRHVGEAIITAKLVHHS
jgi:hypothetical protein